MPISTSDLSRGAVNKADLRAAALAEGFDAVGFAAADFGTQPGEFLEKFIAEKRYGDMDWIVEKAARRRHPQALWPEAKSVIMLGLNYGPEKDPLAYTEEQEHGVISVYAQGRDYHDIIKKKLKRIARGVVRDYGGDVKVFVDTAPVMEKPLAAKAGLGWQGKHTNLLSREFGSWLFLGCIFTTHEITPDREVDGSCGSCRACLDICPTKAFPAPYQLDARRCISYLTIETKSHIDREMRPLIGNRIYGCDDCLAVCPWNKYAEKSREIKLQPRPELIAPRLADLAILDDAAFRSLFTGSPVKRLGRNRFVRNVLIAIGNSRKSAFLDVVTPLLSDASPIVRVAAIWAFGQLADRKIYSRERKKLIGRETDEAVRSEWNLSKGIENEQA
ncbi:tRNA epoxyqueuosine(34) reductase QueG [Sneathiella litorea]|uniref:Epoxyqueuosine reductase n=1 Tax=Sneathiella litorea TaxID=2606216 RepID=A0A6L8W4V6_9PROT|nr:tRNA epoxyqueuosine(34) reductase QueG [Sneathiella litorea]MZR29532.1 tRNA epoxyqueuosine(34) reductase QueG [Sneathiella litorea]